MRKLEYLLALLAWVAHWMKWNGISDIQIKCNSKWHTAPNMNISNSHWHCGALMTITNDKMDAWPQQTHTTIHYDCDWTNEIIFLFLDFRSLNVSCLGVLHLQISCWMSPFVLKSKVIIVQISDEMKNICGYRSFFGSTDFLFTILKDRC